MTPFSDLSDYLAIPAVTSLALSPDGSWLAATVQSLDPDPKKFATSIWRIDTAAAAPVRLTRSVEGESAPAFLPDGSLLFVSKRPDPTAKQNGERPDARPALWMLPLAGGEAMRLAAPPGGVGGLAAARSAQSYLLAASAFDGTSTADADAGRRKARADAGVTAILHESTLVRYWDHDLGPESPRLLAGSHDGDAGKGDQTRDLTPAPGRALDEQPFDLSPDGTFAVTGWQVPDALGELRPELTIIDVATAARRTLQPAADFDYGELAVSPDGRFVLASRGEHDTYDRPGDVTLVVMQVQHRDGPDAGAGVAPRDLLPGFDRRPSGARWSHDGSQVYFTADDNGRRPVFAVDVATGQVTQITTDDAAYDSLCPAPAGSTLFALRAAISEPPTPVRIDASKPGADPYRLPSPGGTISVPGRVEEVTTTAADGQVIRGWLVLPEGASAQAQAPLLLWVHGGPLSSWNSWSWRWNPWLMAARGYAVLLPDPALSTGYGQGFIARGYTGWGAAPYTDVIAITDAVAGRPDIDANRTAMMGGSFGGYMANWIAGHTDRFAAIVSHAGLWALDQMFGTTDGPNFWRRAFGSAALQPERYAINSPDRHVDRIVTPILLIHGDKDYRVPIGEALRMHWDLVSRGKDVKFLYFPDENHWILKPGDVRVWYETVLAFLAQHVLGEEWERPALL